MRSPSSMFQLVACWFLSWLLVFMNFSALAQSIPSDELMFEVQLQIRQGDRLLGSPVVITKSGDEAFVSVNKPGGYAVRFAVHPEPSSPNVKSGRRLAMNAQVFLNEAGEWKKISSPSLSFLAGDRVGMTSPAPTARGAALLHFSVLAKEIPLRKLTKIANPVKACSLWQQLAIVPLEGAQLPEFTYTSGGDNCCSTGCLTCCGNSACCSDKTNCEGGCCTITQTP